MCHPHNRHKRQMNRRRYTARKAACAPLAGAESGSALMQNRFHKYNSLLNRDLLHCQSLNRQFQGRAVSFRYRRVEVHAESAQTVRSQRLSDWRRKYLFEAEICFHKGCPFIMKCMCVDKHHFIYSIDFIHLIYAKKLP